MTCCTTPLRPESGQLATFALLSYEPFIAEGMFDGQPETAAKAATGLGGARAPLAAEWFRDCEPENWPVCHASHTQPCMVHIVDLVVLPKEHSTLYQTVKFDTVAGRTNLRPLHSTPCVPSMLASAVPSPASPRLPLKVPCLLIKPFASSICAPQPSHLNHPLELPLLSSCAGHHFPAHEPCDPPYMDAACSVRSSFPTKHIYALRVRISNANNMLSLSKLYLCMPDHLTDGSIPTPSIGNSTSLAKQHYQPTL